jgi:hypothetical protein
MLTAAAATVADARPGYPFAATLVRYIRRRRGVMGERSHRLLEEACTAAGVKLGAFDHRIVQRLVGYEPSSAA